MIKNINNQKTFDQLQERANQIIKQGQKEKAKIFANKIDIITTKKIPTFKKNPALLFDYQQLVLKLRKFGGPPFLIPFSIEYTVQLKEKNLENEETFQKVKKAANNIVEHGAQREAQVLTKQLETKLEQAQLPKNRKKEYNKIITDLKLTSIPTLPIEDIQEIIKQHLLDVLDNKDIDIYNRIRITLLGTPDSVRDKYKKNLKLALASSDRQIGSKKIKINNQLRKPKIKWWIDNYIKTLGAGAHSFIQRSNYIFQSPNCKTLSYEDKNKLSFILQFYDIMGISTWKVGSIDNPSVEQFSLPLGIIGAKQPKYTEIKLPKLSPGLVFSKTISSSPDSPMIDKIRKQSQTATHDIKKREKEEKEKIPQEPVLKPELPTQPPAPTLPAKPPVPTSIKKDPSLPTVAPIKSKPKKIKITSPEIKPQKPTQLKPEPEPLKKVILPQAPAIKPKQPIVPKPPTAPKQPTSPEIDKLKSITLKDFQALGPDAKQSAQALLNKIRQFVKTHQQRTLARQNFTQSKLYKLYQETTKQSDLEKKSISQITDERKKQNLPALTEDEYIAVKSISKLI